MVDSRELIAKHCGPDWTPEEAVKALAAAGWTKYSATIWCDPLGRLFRGPALAYAIMREVQ